ncbi:ThiF family adenylyltransferase [uncultured Pontibacter sp.]|uniref:ThiF family adenylyltransferase n=1 Tax=uncultured Pontibacter sp. TaxID=453356 RepID=UPI002624954E|nr:ThiF family adenylyltransferase [uncultured Pontibacter sp.]
MQYQLRVSGNHYKQLQQHLFPGDGKEAVAVALCGRYERDGISILLVHELMLIPHKECYRAEDVVCWKTETILPFLEKASKKNMAILKIHSHPGGFPAFSDVDDESDKDLFSSVFGWCESDSVHGSAVMLPEGRIFGRVFTPRLESFPFDKVSVAGDEIKVWEHNTSSNSPDDFAVRTAQAFGEGTYSKLRRLKVGVVGCSGTGSPTIEQLKRLGIGELVLIDPDEVEHKNLNRILNTTREDANLRRLKTEVLSSHIRETGLGTKVVAYPFNLYDSPEALQELITCDVIFGCVDSVDGRHLISQLTNFYLIPYFDQGVKLDADGKGGIDKISGTVHFIQPGSSSLLSRGQYTRQILFDECLRRQDPVEYSKRLKAGYVHNADVDRPAVISINMQISSMAINEFLNRLHSFKNEPARNYAQVSMDYSDGSICNVAEDDLPVDDYQVMWAGRGDLSTFLRMIELSAVKV